MKTKTILFALVLTVATLVKAEEPIISTSVSHACTSQARCAGTFNSMNRVAIACGLRLIPYFSGGFLTITMEGTPSAMACFARLAR